jgi:hypothetical protein
MGQDRYGGPKAALSPQESVTAMRRLIETFGPNQSGKLYNDDGREDACEFSARRSLKPRNVYAFRAAPARRRVL